MLQKLLQKEEKESTFYTEAGLKEFVYKSIESLIERSNKGLRENKDPRILN